MIPLSETILILMGLLTLAMVVASLGNRVPVPFTVFLVLLGILLGWMAKTWPMFPPVQELRLTPEMVLFLFLPGLIFESALTLDTRQLLRDIIPIMTLAIPALLISTGVIALGLWFVLGIDLLLALLFGALISATDPIAVIAIFKELGVSRRLTVLVEGESLLNDATAIMLFHVLLGMLFLGDSLTIGYLGGAAFELFRVFTGGMAIGALVGTVAALTLFRPGMDERIFLVMSVVVAYLSFVFAESILHVSGIMSVLSAAVVFGVLGISRIPQSSVNMIKEVWKTIALICNSLLFLFVGFLVDIGQILAHIDVILISVFFVFLARAASVYTMVPTTVRLFNIPSISLAERHIMWWGGLKGGLAIAMVLLIPDTLSGKSLLFDLTLGVVLFTLLVNATTIRVLIKLLKIDHLTQHEKTELRYGLVRARQEANSALNRFSDEGLLSTSSGKMIQKMADTVFSLEHSESKKKEEAGQLFIKLLRMEFAELEHLHNIGLLQHYTYLSMKASLQEEREAWIVDPSRFHHDEQQHKERVFKKIERGILKRIREVNWAAVILSQYQHMRFAQSLQRDIALVLIFSKIMEYIEANCKPGDQERARLLSIYAERLRLCKQNLRAVETDFPDFYLKFENNIISRVVFTASGFAVRDIHQYGEIGDRVNALIEQRVHEVLASLHTISRFSPSDLTEFLKKVPLFQGLSEKTLLHIARVAKSVTFLPGDEIIGQGQRGNALYVILHGKANVYKGSDNALLAELGNGNFMGEVAVLGGVARTASVRAMVPSALLRITRREMMALAKESAELKNRLEEIKLRREIKENP